MALAKPPTLVAMRAELKSIRPELTHTYLKKMSRESLAIQLAIECKQVGKLQNVANSCYMDSLFVALFSTNSDFINKNVLDAHISHKDVRLSSIAEKVKTAMNQVAVKVREGHSQTCTNLRRLFQNFDKVYRENNKFENVNWTTAQQEPMDVMKCIHRIFSIPDQVKYSYESWGNKTLITKEDRITSFTDVIVRVTPFDFPNNAPILLKDYMKTVKECTTFENPADYFKGPNGKLYKKKCTVIKYLSAPFMYVHVDRNFAGEKCRNPVIPPKKIKLLKDPHPIYLNGLIIHHGGASGGHYTACFVCKGVWYHFDDLRPNHKAVIGTFEDLLKRSDILNKSVDFIYM
jgi:hypothetical protein